MRPPIFIVEGVDVLVCLTVTEAESAIKPPDVRAGGNTAYDADGTVLELSIEKHGKWIFRNEIVRIRDSSSATRKSEELKAALLSYLIAAGEVQEGIDAEPLSELVGRLVQRECRWRSKSFLNRLLSHYRKPFNTT